MQYVHYWGYIWIKYRPPVFWMVWCHASLLKWSCSLWSTEKAKWSIYTTSCGESEAAWGRENRAKRSPLSGSTQSGARANILSVNAILSPLSLVAAVLLSVFSSALITFAGVRPRIPSRLFTPLIFYFPHVFSGPPHFSSNTKHQHNGQRLSWASFHTYFHGNTTMSLTLLAHWWSLHVLQATNAAWICATANRK